MTGMIAVMRAANFSMDDLVNETVPRNASWFNRAMQLVLIYPPTVEPTTRTLINTVILICCLTLGICGNASQIALQWYTNRLRINRTPATSNCSQLYICLLHLVHFAISVSLPSVIIDKLVKIWMFGMLTCRSHFIFVTLGRTIAGWAIALLFFDQYVVVASLKKVTGHLRAFFSFSLALVALAASIVLVPSLFFVRIKEVILHEDSTTPGTLLRIRTYSCSTRPSRPLSPYLSVLNFTVEYVLPSMIVLVAARRTSAILKTVDSTSTRLDHKRRSKFLVVLASMHFLAYLPYWLDVFLAPVNEKWRFEVPQWLHSTLEDAVLLLPQITASTAWMPASYLSKYLSSLTCSYRVVAEGSAFRSAQPRRGSPESGSPSMAAVL